MFKISVNLLFQYLRESRTTCFVDRLVFNASLPSTILFGCWFVMLANRPLFVRLPDPLSFSSAMFMFVWRHCIGCRKRLAGKFINLIGTSPTAENRSDTVQYENMPCTIMIKKNEFYGFIIVRKKNKCNNTDNGRWYNHFMHDVIQWKVRSCLRQT